ncbi:hypothetical protein B5807_05402 [Epicoccum nigrum]|uniref:Uncharacterized protein n=1 Tax=Epicoccum nigrum TaxID=105696 RepID=A0A1Y2LZ87_EPING|nr:hypothetical protein B5807_05402 [Epicoccum nigrum]
MLVGDQASIGHGLSTVKEAWKHAYSSGNFHTVSQKVFQKEISGRFTDESSLMPQDSDGNGRSPSAGQLLKILDIMEAYIAGSRTRDTAGTSGVIDDVAANKIDKWAKRKKSIPSARTEQGYRRYMKRRPRKTTDDALLSQSSITPPKTTNDALLSRDTSNVSNV